MLVHNWTFFSFSCRDECLRFGFGPNLRFDQNNQGLISTRQTESKIIGLEIKAQVESVDEPGHCLSAKVVITRSCLEFSSLVPALVSASCFVVVVMQSFKLLSSSSGRWRCSSSCCCCCWTSSSLEPGSRRASSCIGLCIIEPMLCLPYGNSSFKV